LLPFFLAGIEISLEQITREKQRFCLAQRVGAGEHFFLALPFSALKLAIQNNGAVSVHEEVES